MADGDKTSGYLTLLPYMAKDDLNVEAMVFVPSPWGAPLFIGSRGTRTDDGAAFLAVVGENPVGWVRMASPMGKKQLELLHLRRLATDCRTATGYELFDAITATGEKPDFVVVAQGKSAGWEMTQFAIAERRLAQELFFQVTSRVADLQRHKTGHLSGYQVHMWFGEASDAAALPYKQNDATAYNQLVDCLTAHTPDPDQFKVDSDKLPEQVPAMPVRAVSDVQFISVPLLGGVPASPFYAATGMNLGLAFQSDHIARDEWVKLRQVVHRKDKQHNNVLVISAGAPDRLGRCYASEEALASFLLEHPSEVETTHLSSVILHFWSTGQAFELIGETPRELWPALFQGFMPSSHPFVQPANESTPSS
jgi:hypothetical protein